ncbi:MAG: vanadium-dependent haloperoxidase [Phycisphaerae bacterium]|nr:vanadium-dependent haloperoxidase [Saprospiraceae bacterium]
MKKTKLTKIFALGAILLGIMLVPQSCGEDKRQIDTPLPNAHDFDYKVYWEWNETFLQIDRYARGYRPGPGPRALGYLGLSAYECVVSAIPENRSIADLYGGLKVPKADPDLEYYWPACVNESYAYLMERFFPHMQNDPKFEVTNAFGLIAATRAKLHGRYLQETTPEILERSEKFGREVAAAIYVWEQSDLIGHNAFLDPIPASYVAPVGPGLWTPTPPDYTRAMFPQWGQVRTFAINQEEKICRPPIPYGENPNSPFYAQAWEVYTTVNAIRNPPPGLEDWAANQKWAAIFWSDDILNLTFAPPPRLIAILNEVAANEELDLAGCAEAYAKMGLALSDAGVALWNSKYIYNVERPTTYIQRIISRDDATASNWLPILDATAVGGKYGVTPAFPAYPSGHSGFGGAGGKILSSFFEYNANHPGTYTFTDLCHQLRTEFLGTPRTFTSFSQLGEEDAYSRIPLGVHFRMDCEVGLEVGRLCAQRVLELPWKK